MMSEFLAHKEAYNVAVVGATGAVGQTMLEVLAERNFPVANLVPLASSRSAGSKIEFKGQDYVVQDLEQFDPAGLDIALFSAGGGTSLQHAPRFAEAGCYVIDNSSAWRMHDDVCLVVPEVNLHALEMAKVNRIIANPNCSTIQMVVALKPLHDAVPIKRVIVSTYQAVSGAGSRAIQELAEQTRNLLSGIEAEVNVLPARIAFNVVPQIDVFMDDGYTKEERKMIDETRKIMEADIAVTATTVRVPVFYAHSESVNVTFEGPMSPDMARNLLADAEGVCVVDDPGTADYPMPSEAAGTDPVWVGRIREDKSCANSLSLWVVADNIRKGAALNAVQIAEKLICD
ncbi:MAG: aspartate-semialdehyde dehydrogenase [Zetaproteobacteria bacterium CG12_big_fil_rev_8_21_14_0_65_55_1124]|nr:MAG: aspartate-semialdehyde dehydrogenase [Zetaproteobacteria bacterium CG1_02_55_237]PIS20499.1 MAG: aspartate-semialdehyde dehydrogenase [Zetaproteobacteria bacterium CG08_land_8_20_14_0_20_55_17]PIW43777.1 MAG: aspartate-semialdehyde dehydrogenase [Zetaproteobacteria bacterium CG12_big_fil_rev_8_21_14_0_65_55_1124]PIY53312.1 MAG: aspartate-semialdehyde dehydrogenase [Zetaproteobacteria bacterium CG_4_10_14_0_8_um_filter_55_43]PIZ40115.1 MAG: aspartate-semialdehyde dehydrogenase [Zetaprote